MTDTDTESLPRRSSPGARRRLFWSFGAQTIAILLRIVQQLLLVPILIRGWGSDLYSDWIIVFSTTSFLTVLDFGFQIYFGNALLFARSRKNVRAYRRLYATALFIYAVILCAAAVLLAGASAIVSWPAYFGTHVMAAPEALCTAVLLAVSTLTLIPFGFVTAIYRAHGDFSRGAVINITADSLRGLAVCAVVFLGGGPMEAALVYLVIAILFPVGVIFDQWRAYGELPPGISVPKPSELRHAINRSTLYLAPTLTTPVVLNVPIMLLGIFGAPSTAVVAYSVSRTFTGFMRQVVQQFCHPVGVEMAHQSAIGDHAKLRHVFMGAGRMVGGAAGLLGGFTLIVADPFLRFWTHGGVAYDPWLVGAFIATIILTAPAQVALMLYQYNNKPRILVIAQSAYTVGTVVFCLLLISGFSATGAAAGIGLAEFLSIGLLLPYAAAKEVSSSLLMYLLRSYVTALAAFVLSYTVAWEGFSLLSVHGLASMIEFGLLWTAIVVLPAYFLLLEQRERQWLFEKVGKRFERFKQKLSHRTRRAQRARPKRYL